MWAALLPCPANCPWKGISASWSRQAHEATVSLLLHSSKCTPLESGAKWVCGTALATGLCPEFSGCTWFSGFKSVPALQNGYEPLCIQFSPIDLGTAWIQMLFHAVVQSQPWSFKVYWCGTCSGQTWQYCSSDGAGSGSKIALFSTEQESAESQIIMFVAWVCVGEDQPVIISCLW